MSESTNNTGKIVGIIILIIILLGGAGGGYYIFIHKPKQEAKEKARLEQIAIKEAEQKQLELEAQKKSEYENLIVKADKEYENENWPDAKSFYTKASSLLPGQQYAKDRLTTVNAKLSEIAEKEAKRKAGIIETVNASTGRFYVIASSSIDDDLAMDYAKKLSWEGHKVKLIEHQTQKNDYYRVAVADFDNRSSAEAAITSFSLLEGQLWVLKY